MARIRSIKPEFWTSPQVMECSTNARLLFIGLWNFCDDAGRHPVNARQIKARIFPGDMFSDGDILRMLDELSTNGLIVRYLVDGVEFLEVTGWHHQKIDKRQPSKIPGPFDERSTIIVFDHSANAPRSVAPDRIGVDRSGGESPSQEVTSYQFSTELADGIDQASYPNLVALARGGRLS